MELDELLGDYRRFVRAALLRTLEAGIDVSDDPIDHLCYRVADWDGYRRMSRALAAESALVAAAIHNGREIAKFVLRTPLVVGSRSVPLIELPGPKEGSPYPEGLEHLELVVPDYEGFVARYRDALLLEGSASNPTAVLRGQGPGVKFHARSLREVVEAEGVVFLPPA